MPDFTVYERSTGKVLFSGTSDVPAAFSNESQGVIEDSRHDGGWIDSGGVHRLPPDQPSESHVFDWQAKQWIDPRTLLDRQDAAWGRIKVAREAFFDAPLVTPYGVFDSDPVSRGRITDAVLMVQTLAAIGQPASVDFTLADDSVVTLDVTQMVTVGLLLGQKVQTAFGISRLRREAIYAATTPEAVEAVTWEG